MENVKVKKIFDQVLELPIYDSVDYEYAEDFFANKYDKWGGACTAVAKFTDDGKMLIGRNMDLNVSKKPAYVVRTKIPDNYETVGVAYSNQTGPDYEEALENGVPEKIIKILPFLCTDVFNEKGLYVETNMRNGEFWTDGSYKYQTQSTNANAIERVCALLLPRYIGQNCATVKEAIEYVNSLDIYTPNVPKMQWNFCYMMADNTGDYGVLEIAHNKVSWLEKEPAQANFYLTKEFQKYEELPSGIGRYKVVTEGRDAVKKEDDMFNLINKVSYSKIYYPDTCEFDIRTDFAGLEPSWTYDFIQNDEYKDEVMEKIRNKCVDVVGGKTKEQLKEEGRAWESAFTNVVNCTDKTWMVRFFEDNDKKLNLSFK